MMTLGRMSFKVLSSDREAKIGSGVITSWFGIVQTFIYLHNICLSFDSSNPRKSIVLVKPKAINALINIVFVTAERHVLGNQASHRFFILLPILGNAFCQPAITSRVRVASLYQYVTYPGWQ